MSWFNPAESDINVGDEVYGSDNNKVGTVARSPRVVVEKGFFFPTDYYIPMISLAQCQCRPGHTDHGQGRALRSGWDTVFYTDTVLTPCGCTSSGGQDVEALALMKSPPMTSCVFR